MTTKMAIDSVVLSIFGKVLGITPSRISSSDDFAKLGGNSFKAAEIAAELKKTHPSLAITPEDVLRCSTAGALVDFIKRQGIS